MATLEISLRANRALAPAPSRGQARSPKRVVLVACGGLAIAAATLLLTHSPTSEELVMDLRTPAKARVGETQISTGGTGVLFSLVQGTALLGATPLEDELDAWRRDGERGLRGLLGLGRQPE